MRTVVKYQRHLLATALLMLCMCNMRGQAIKVTIHTDDFRVASEAWMDNGRLYGVQPGNMVIDAMQKDSTSHRIFESIGCTCYEMNQSYLSFEFTAYSDITFLYTTFCSIEDQEQPIRPEWCSIKQRITFDKNGLRGDVAIINYENILEDLKQRMGQDYVPLPEMKSVLENIQGEYYYPYPDALCLLIEGYLCQGASAEEVLAFMEAFKKTLFESGFEPDAQRNFTQDYAVYKFILEHQGQELNMNQLEEFAKIAYGLNEFYGNHLN